MKSVFKTRHTSDGISTKKCSHDIFLLCNTPFDSYADRLNKLMIKSLEYCRLEFDIILMFKIYRKLSDL